MKTLSVYNWGRKQIFFPSVTKRRIHVCLSDARYFRARMPRVRGLFLNHSPPTAKVLISNIHPSCSWLIKVLSELIIWGQKSSIEFFFKGRIHFLQRKQKNLESLDTFIYEIDRSKSLFDQGQFLTCKEFHYFKYCSELKPCFKEHVNLLPYAIT